MTPHFNKSSQKSPNLCTVILHYTPALSLDLRNLSTTDTLLYLRSFID